MSNSNMPMAAITVNKGRKKVKNSFVYLNNGQNFEIELFNPTSDTILSKIEINNKSISNSGIVLRPGERVFLERYLDSPNKFQFDTYEVNGDSDTVQKAISKNGLVKVRFFREDTTPLYNTTLTLGNSWNNTGTVYGRTTFDTNTLSDTLSFNATDIGSTNSLTFDDSQYKSLSSVSSVQTSHSPNKAKKRSKKTETGTVEKGGHSNQSFQTVSKRFYSYAFKTIEYQIKPVSQQVNDVKSIVRSKYCTDCGKKAKYTNKFCSNCGNKL